MEELRLGKLIISFETESLVDQKPDFLQVKKLNFWEHDARNSIAK